jgi:nucleoid-associated protein YgaU
MTADRFADLPTALFQLTSALLLAALAWATLVALLASWRPTKRIALALTPRLIRAAVFTTVSGTLVISPARAASDLDGLPFPDRSVTAGPVGPAAPSTPASPATPTASSDHHVVQTGESLWSIAADTLPPRVTAAQVASASASWYDANRAAIGPDPDLIHPGQLLAAPDAEATR